MNSKTGGYLNQLWKIRKCLPDSRGAGHKEELRLRGGGIKGKMVVKYEQSCDHAHMHVHTCTPGWVQKVNNELEVNHAALGTDNATENFQGLGINRFGINEVGKI